MRNRKKTVRVTFGRMDLFDIQHALGHAYLRTKESILTRILPEVNDKQADAYLAVYAKAHAATKKETGKVSVTFGTAELQLIHAACAIAIAEVTDRAKRGDCRSSEAAMEAGGYQGLRDDIGKALGLGGPK